MIKFINIAATWYYSKHSSKQRYAIGSSLGWVDPIYIYTTLNNNLINEIKNSKIVLIMVEGNENKIIYLLDHNTIDEFTNKYMMLI